MDGQIGAIAALLNLHGWTITDAHKESDQSFPGKVKFYRIFLVGEEKQVKAVPENQSGPGGIPLFREVQDDAGTMLSSAKSETTSTSALDRRRARVTLPSKRCNWMHFSLSPRSRGVAVDESRAFSKSPREKRQNLSDSWSDIEASFQRLSNPKNLAPDGREDRHRNLRRRTVNTKPVRRGKSVPTAPRSPWR